MVGERRQFLVIEPAYEEVSLQELELAIAIEVAKDCG